MRLRLRVRLRLQLYFTIRFTIIFQNPMYNSNPQSELQLQVTIRLTIIRLSPIIIMTSIPVHDNTTGVSDFRTYIGQRPKSI